MQAATIGGDSVDRRRRGEREGGEADVSPNGRRVSEPPTDFSCFGRLIGAEFKGAGGKALKVRKACSMPNGSLMMALRDVFFEMFPNVETMMETLVTLHVQLNLQNPC